MPSFAHVPVFEYYPLRQLNTFGLSATARFFAEIYQVNDYINLLQHQSLKNMPKLVLGGGSNILFTHDFNGLVIKNNITGISVLEENTKNVIVRVGAGENWHDFVMFCVQNNWGGVENLALIPGTVGACPIQNIGAYGMEVKDTILSVETIQLDNGKSIVFSNQDCQFGYRDSIFKKEWKNQLLISAVIFKLNKQYQLNLSYGAIRETLAEMQVNAPTLKEVCQAVISIRQSKLPNPAEIGNCGSFFKNPEISISQYEALKVQYPTMVSFPLDNLRVKIAAGWLIEQCGWKGKTVGRAGVYEKQALVLVNKGNATSEEVLALTSQIIASVKATFGITLEPEVNII